MLIDHSKEKLYNAIIYFVSNTKFCGKTKLFKLLYYLDFLHFKETSKSVTGLKYYTWPMGPVPKDLATEIPKPSSEFKAFLSCNDPGNGDFVDIKPKKRFDDTYFSKRELRLLENICFIFKEAKSDIMVESTHLPNQPWDKTKKLKGMNVEIDYMLALDTSVKSISSEEAFERINDRNQIILAFSD